MRPQRATTSIREKMTVVSKIRGSSTSERLMHEPRDVCLSVCLSLPISLVIQVEPSDRCMCVCVCVHCAGTNFWIKRPRYFASWFILTLQEKLRKSRVTGRKYCCSGRCDLEWGFLVICLLAREKNTGEFRLNWHSVNPRQYSCAHCLD